MFLKENGYILKKHAMTIENRVRLLPTVYEDCCTEEELAQMLAEDRDKD